MPGQPSRPAVAPLPETAVEPQRRLARDLLALSQRQLAAAAGGDWESLVACLDERARLTAAVAALEPPTLDAASRQELRAALVAALDLDRQVQMLARAAQTNLDAEFARLRRGRQALHGYGRPAGTGGSTVIDRPG